MFRTFNLPPRCGATLLCVAAIALSFTGCQSPQGAAQAKKRLETLKSDEAGFQKWRMSYRQASDRLANAPAWAPPSSRTETRVAERKSTYSQVNVSVKVVAMTFDDGPHASYTPRLLDIMKQRGIKATFFVLGQNAQEYPAILRRIAAEGHEIASHSWSHPYLPKLSLSAVRKQFEDTRQAIVSATGVEPKLFRPPYGAVNAAIKHLGMTEFGCSTILWSVDPEDWKRPGISVVASRLVNGAHPGAILLAHDIHGPTIDAMPAAFDRLTAQGYRFVTVSELIQMEEPPKTASKPSAPISSSLGALAKAGSQRSSSLP